MRRWSFGLILILATACASSPTEPLPVDVPVAAAEVALSTAAVLRCQWELQEKREPPLH